MENPEEYKGENFDTIEGAWDWHSRCIPETVYSPEELEYLMGEQVMFKKDFEEATAKLLSHLQPDNNDYAVKVIETELKKYKEIQAETGINNDYAKARLEEGINLLSRLLNKLTANN